MLGGSKGDLLYFQYETKFLRRRVLSRDVSRDNAGKLLLWVKFEKTMADPLWMSG